MWKYNTCQMSVIMFEMLDGQIVGRGGGGGAHIVVVIIDRCGGGRFPRHTPPTHMLTYFPLLCNGVFIIIAPINTMLIVFVCVGGGGGAHMVSVIIDRCGGGRFPRHTPPTHMLTYFPNPEYL